ncbi:MAG: filamentous hemagglutinin N-terminal domain-containing protein, partial [Rhodanobacter sp.]|nr:filamentous hemagglutinin N-terminal domain-containing protein [Rhodanobacter sp.]
MNRIYRLVWNRTLGVLQVASEFTRARTRGGRTAGPGRVRRLAWLAGVPLGLPLAALATPMAAVSLAPVSTETATIAAVSPGTLPTGGTVTAGRGQITQGGNTLTVTQQSQNLSLNWQTFNVGPDGTVNFLQPNAQAIAVNRISDANGSVILGHLNANGQVFLINPNGVLFGQGAQVNVGGLV